MSINELKMLAGKPVSLNEAYYGERVVKRIDDAVVKICNLVIDDPDINLDNHQVNRELQNAIMAVFGFSSAKVIWTVSNWKHADICNCCTLPNMKVLHTGSVKEGKSGKYDSTNTLDCTIVMNTPLISDVGLTPKEVTAILIHEIGHNLDYSLMSVVHIWYKILTACLRYDPKYYPQLAAEVIGITFLNEFPLLKELYFRMRFLGDTVMKAYTPLISVGRSLGKVIYPLEKLISAIVFIPLIAIRLPIIALLSPLNRVLNATETKGEVEADNFAASYGYGSYLASALDKISAAMVYTKGSNSDNVVNMIFRDIAIAECELIAMFQGDHGANVQRSYRCLSKLEEDLRNKDCPPELRKELEDKVKVMRESHELLLNMDDEDITLWRRAVRLTINNITPDGRPHKDIISVIKRELRPEYEYEKFSFSDIGKASKFLENM